MYRHESIRDSGITGAAHEGAEIIKAEFFFSGLRRLWQVFKIRRKRSVQGLSAAPRAGPRTRSRSRGERREAAAPAGGRSLADGPASADDADVVFAGGHGVISSGQPLKGEEAVARLLSSKTGSGRTTALHLSKIPIEPA